MRFLLEIITPERRVFSEQVDMVTVPTPLGTVGILGHHMPLFSALTEGEIKITRAGGEYFLAIGGGFMEVTSARVSILVTRAVHPSELNEAEIKKAQAQAREALKKKLPPTELASAQAILRRSVIEMNLLRRQRRRAAPPLTR